LIFQSLTFVEFDRDYYRISRQLTIFSLKIGHKSFGLIHEQIATFLILFASGGSSAASN